MSSCDMSETSNILHLMKAIEQPYNSYYPLLVILSLHIQEGMKLCL